MENPPSIRDVARAAGVGASTVSLALRNDHRLRPSMREHVQKIARELGYRPNATVANLMAQLRASKTAKFQSTLGFLNASDNRGILQEIATYREWTRGAEARARELGYGMDFFWLQEPGLTPARLKQILITRGIRGIIVAAMQTHGVLPAKYSELWIDFSCIALGMRPQDPELHFAVNDQFSTAFHAVEELLRLGYRRPALVIDEKIDAWLEYRFSSGFFAARDRAAGAKNIREPRIPTFPFVKSEAKEFQAWFAKHRPDAIVTLHQDVFGWLEKAGAKIPEDVGLVHLDREIEMTAWAGMDQNSYCVGSAATDMLVGQLHNNDLGVPAFPKAILIQSRWMEGTSVSARKTKKSADSGVVRA